MGSRGDRNMLEVSMRQLLRTALWGCVLGFSLVRPASRLAAQPGAKLVEERTVPFARPAGSMLIPGLPRWSGNGLLDVELNFTGVPQIWITGRDGVREVIPFSIREAGRIALTDVCAGQDGALAISGGAYTSNSRGATFIGWISPDRQKRTITQIWPYVAERLALAADGMIWTVGFLKDEANTTTVSRNLLRRFDPSGGMLTSSAVRGRATRVLPRDATPMSYLVASGDRVGWYTNGGEYIEFSLDGKEIGRLDGPAQQQGPNGEDVSGVAMSGQNRLLVGVSHRDTRSWQVMELDRTSRTWVKAVPDAGSVVGVAGFDGETAVLTGSDGKTQILMRRFAPAGGSPAAQSPYPH